MRRDMNKVVIERPRTGGTGARDQYKQAEKNVDFTDEDALYHNKRGGQGRTYGWDSKQLSDLLGPLKGYLRKQVGRNWDKVFSEIAQQFKGGGTSAAHIKGHILDYVQTKVVYVGKVPHEHTAYGKKNLIPITSRSQQYPQFYVDKIGRLQIAPKSWEKKKAEPKTDPSRVIKGDRVFFRIAGLWYEGEFESVVPAWRDVWNNTLSKYEKKFIKPTHVPDLIEGESTSVSRLTRLYGSECYVARKRQLNSKELKRHGLKNGAGYKVGDKVLIVRNSNFAGCTGEILKMEGEKLYVSVDGDCIWKAAADVEHA